jgi:hypothetical protein
MGLQTARNMVTVVAAPGKGNEEVKAARHSACAIQASTHDLDIAL